MYRVRYANSLGFVIGFRTKSNGSIDMYGFTKEGLVDPEDNNETKADSINFQSDTIAGQFVKLAYPNLYWRKTGKVWWKMRLM